MLEFYYFSIFSAHKLGLNVADHSEMKKVGTNRRLGDRLILRRAAKMIDEAGCITDVNVLDLSSTGARLSVAVEAAIPQRFILRIAGHGRDYAAELARRAGTEVGVRLGTEDEFRLLMAHPTPLAPKNSLSIAALRQIAQSSRR